MPHLKVSQEVIDKIEEQCALAVELEEDLFSDGVAAALCWILGDTKVLPSDAGSAFEFNDEDEDGD